MKSALPGFLFCAKAPTARSSGKPKGKSDWMKNFALRSGSSLLSAQPSRDPMLAAEFRCQQPKANGAPGKTGPAIFALFVSEDRCSGASPKQICQQKPKPPERASYGPV
jgi:hypothetical protein